MEHQMNKEVNIKYEYVIERVSRVQEINCSQTYGCIWITDCVIVKKNNSSNHGNEITRSDFKVPLLLGILLDDNLLLVLTSLLMPVIDCVRGMRCKCYRSNVRQHNLHFLFIQLNTIIFDRQCL